MSKESDEGHRARVEAAETYFKTHVHEFATACVLLGIHHQGGKYLDPTEARNCSWEANFYLKVAATLGHALAICLRARTKSTSQKREFAAQGPLTTVDLLKHVRGDPDGTGFDVPGYSQAKQLERLERMAERLGRENAMEVICGWEATKPPPDWEPTTTSPSTSPTAKRAKQS